jgi:hypothetical protein
MLYSLSSMADWFAQNEALRRLCPIKHKQWLANLDEACPKRFHDQNKAENCDLYVNPIFLARFGNSSATA